MSETTFRAVVASVMVGFLALAIIVFIGLVPRSTEPSPSGSVANTAVPSRAPSVSPTRNPGPAFAAPNVVGVGTVPRGTTSTRTVELRFVEPIADAIAPGAGSFTVTLADSAGDGSAAGFVGTPAVDAPGSLGATVKLLRPNVLVVSIADSDPLNVESMTISGLAVQAYSAAATGSIDVAFGVFTGSLVQGVAGETVVSIGSISAGS